MTSAKDELEDVYRRLTENQNKIEKQRVQVEALELTWKNARTKLRRLKASTYKIIRENT